MCLSTLKHGKLTFSQCVDVTLHTQGR
uniref:Uncharacterized protein n=1 Tax=Arundo donax TaxID=35708 RepID=A0A0A9PRV4_ARUDO